VNPKVLLSLAAAIYGVTGMGLLFAPLEFGPFLGLSSLAANDVPLQMASAGLIGFAALNWMGRGAIYGGIYGRPIAVANFGFGAVLAPTLMQYQMSGQGQPLGWVLSVLVTALWLAYGALLWSKPWFPEGDRRRVLGFP
jgi:hypothetical protein